MANNLLHYSNYYIDRYSILCSLVVLYQTVQNCCIRMSSIIVLNCYLWHSLMISMCLATEFWFQYVSDMRSRRTSRRMVCIAACWKKFELINRRFFYSRI